jgi:hypothetical protein
MSQQLFAQDEDYDIDMSNIQELQLAADGLRVRRLYHPVGRGQLARAQPTPAAGPPLYQGK